MDKCTTEQIRAVIARLRETPDPPKFEVVIHGMRMTIGAGRGFKKGHYTKDVLGALRKAALKEVEAAYTEAGSEPFVRPLPFTVQITVKERWLVTDDPKITVKGELATGAYFKPGRPVAGPVHEAFNNLEKNAWRLLRKLTDDKDYAAEVVVKWVWDKPNPVKVQPRTV